MFKSKMKFLALFLIGISIFVNCWTLKDGHNWGDDFAQYIINARNIADGKPYLSGVMLENTVVYPPGLPLMLAPVLKIFGENLKIFKLLNILLWFLSIGLVYLLLSEMESRRVGLMTAVFLAFSSFFFTFKQNVLSDIPFFFFVTVSLYTFNCWRKNFYNRQGIFFICFLLSMSAALWVRSAGVTLFIAAMFYFIFIDRRIKLLTLVLILFMVNELFLSFWMGGHAGFWASIGHSPQEFLLQIFANFAKVYRSLWFFFCPSQTIFSQNLYNMVDIVVCWVAFVPFLMMVWSFFRGFQAKNISYLECFSFFYLCLLVFWSGFMDPPKAFCRFVLPLLPFIFIGVKRVLVCLNEKFRLSFFSLARIAFLVLLLINATNMIINWNFNDDVWNLPENKELVGWIKGHMEPAEYFMFWKPRALAFLTGREGTAPWIFAWQRPYFHQRVKDMKISYVFSFKFDDFQGLTEQLEGDKRFRLVWENRFYKIFKFVD